MHKHLFLLLCLVTFSPNFAQKTNENTFALIDKKIAQIPDSLTQSTSKIGDYINTHFNNDTQKVRAIYFWTASTLSYDVKNMFVVNEGETRENKIENALKTRKGICEHYASIFQDLCSKTGIKSYIINGYTKQNTNSECLPHVWCAAKINDNWFLFDPTWGSGYISNKKFVRKFSNDYYMASPAFLIKTHMPFDYMWQFLKSPITPKEFDYNVAIATFEKQSKIEQTKAIIARIEKNGVKNALTFEQLKYYKNEIQNEKTDAYNLAAKDFNLAISLFNNFISYRNNQFKPTKTDDGIKDMIDQAAFFVKETQVKLNNISDPDAKNAKLITQLYMTSNEISLQIKEQQNWLNEYLSKGKIGRKMMFLK